jgi:hypothetical protein
MKVGRAGEVEGSNRRRRFGRHRLTVVLLGIVAALLALPALAGAKGAHFTYELCDSALPGGGPPAWDFHTNPGVPYTPWQTCASPGGAIGISQTGAVSTTPAWINIGVASPPEGFVEAITISAAAWNLQPGNEASHVYTDGWPLNNGGFTARLFHVRDEASIFFQGAGFSIVMTCSISPCNPGGTIAVNNIAVTEVDVVAPRVKKVEGPMLGGGTLRGHQALSAEATDVGGGLTNLEVRVNGLPAAPPTTGICAVARVINANYQGIAATSPSPCPGKLTGTWLIDTAAAPFQNGANTVQICASDFATSGDPNTTCSAPQTVEVNNTCTESPVTGGQILSASFSGSNSESVTVPFGKPAEVSGVLANNAGDPISGATICIQARTQGGRNWPTPLATATTDAQGQFAYELPPGPNRDVLVGYRHDSFQVARTINYHAHARPTVNLRPGRVRAGDRIRITGKLPGPRAAGRVVILQASSLHGSRWLTFHKATTGRKGGFASSYRFGGTDSTITYRIRAVVPRQQGYPYDPGHSKPARVKVRA